jgi:hypothetical protein
MFQSTRRLAMMKGHSSPHAIVTAAPHQPRRDGDRTRCNGDCAWYGRGQMLFATGVGSEIASALALRVLSGLLMADEVVDIFLPVRYYWVRRARWLKLQEKKRAMEEAARVNGEPQPAPALVSNIAPIVVAAGINQERSTTRGASPFRDMFWRLRSSTRELRATGRRGALPVIVPKLGEAGTGHGHSRSR